MKVLYCNPVFLDYRLPFYKQLVSLFKGDFTLCIPRLVII